MCRVDEQGLCRERLQVSGLVILLVLGSGNERGQVREGQDADGTGERSEGPYSLSLKLSGIHLIIF